MTTNTTNGLPGEMSVNGGEFNEIAVVSSGDTVTGRIKTANAEEGWEERFYQKFTDGADKENDYYDCEIIEGKAYRIVDFFTQELAAAEERGVEKERVAWLKGNRCGMCGNLNDTSLSDVCAKCIEEQ